MKYLLILLVLVGCSREPKYAAGDCIILNSNHFYRNHREPIRIIEWNDYSFLHSWNEIEYMGRFGFADYRWFKESDIRQQVDCPLE